MDDVARRLAALSPEQRRLLELRLKQHGLSSAGSQDSYAAPASPQNDAVIDEPSNRDEWKQKPARRAINFSLYFFSDDGSQTSDDKYRLLLESAIFADAHGFAAVWTPERHFQDFGGLYPNPSVLSAALAVITERAQIRAGSVALPLHHPIRAAEEWAVVDNLSKGRVGVSFASGWHPADFVLSPNNYDNRKQIMFDYIDKIKRLWSGEAVKFKGVGEDEVEVKILPRPVQPSLPMWITTAGSLQTWIKAGEIGANILAALVGYSLDDLARRIAVYRDALASNGHDVSRGQVTIMAHTFVGENNEDVKRRVKAPLCHYLRSYFNQFENFGFDADTVTDDDKHLIVEKAFEHYFNSSSLLGTHNKCARLIDRLIEAGVDEIACLVDFGLDADSVLASLRSLDDLRSHYAQAASASKSDMF